MSAALEDSRQHLESSESARVELEQELGELRASMEDAQARLKAAEERAERAESELRSQESDASSMSAALEDSRQLLKSSEAARVELEQDLGELLASLADAQARLKAAEERAERAKPELAADLVDETVPAGESYAAHHSAEPASRDVPVEAEIVGPVHEAEAAVLAWADAWAAQDIDAYLDAYATNFEPQYGTPRSAWEAQRRVRLAQPTLIEIGITELEIELVGPNRARATFRQSYTSDTFSDVVSKTLLLTLTANGWKIESEEATN